MHFSWLVSEIARGRQTRALSKTCWKLPEVRGGYWLSCFAGKNSKTIAKGLSSHEGSTSFESACEPSSARASDCQSDPGQRIERQRSGSLEQSSLPSPPAEMRLAEHVEIPCSSEEDSTKKEDEPADEDPVEDDQSSEGEYSLGTAEGIEGEPLDITTKTGNASR